MIQMATSSTIRTTEEYEAAYARLNAEQKEAVDTIDGPVFVIAGPGTGKTQILTLRIANILQKTDTPPETILALTFTEAGASEMRARLARMIGARGHRVRIHTFHGFAESLIARYPDAFPRIVGGEIATDIERAEMFDTALLETPVQYLRPFGDPLYYHYIVSNAVATMKRENVTPKVLRARIAESENEYESIPDKVHAKGKYEGKLKGEYETLQKKITKTKDLLAVYEAYEAELTKRHRYDFEDVILEVVRALAEDESFRREVQESVFYVHADEHQDANRAQNALLEMLVEHDDRPNLFIVGDEKQAIYRFQGADLDNVHYFREHFPETKIIALVANYRSHQTILDTALSLIEASPDERLSRVPLQASDSAAKGDDSIKNLNIPVLPPLRRANCETPTGEMNFLAQEIQSRLDAGISTEEIVVLVRRNQDVSDVVNALQERGIPVSRGVEGNALHNRFVAVLVRLLEAITTPRDEVLAGLFTLPGFAMSGADVWRIMDIARREKVPALDVLASDSLLESAKVHDKESAKKLRATLDELSRLASVERPAVVAQGALSATGILDSVLMASDRAESLAAIRELLTAFEELSSREHEALLPRALALLEVHEARGIALTRGSIETPGLVRVMTVHKSKGREFGHVFIPRLTDRIWSARSRAEHFYVPDVLSGSAELEDERRLLYVAITRAKHAATLSYSMTREDGKEESSSALLEELDSSLIKEIELTKEIAATADDEAQLLIKQSARAAKMLDPIHALQPSKDDLNVLRRAFIAQGLSPTALNNYLECTWKYFYVNLLRIPEAENKHMLYGTAIHLALNAYANRRIRNEDYSVEYVISVFERAISRTPLDARDLAELQKKGNRALPAWHEEHATNWPEKTESELPVNAPITITIEGENGVEEVELGLRGKLDRVDEISGGKYCVIDYKTGKSKSRNELMGETKDADGNYYRQLIFYKLLLEYTEESRDMTEGVIEFVEPDEKGRIKSEKFDITGKEVEELKTLIRKCANEILTLSFWNTSCDVEECKWCALRFSNV
jgi:DNA helicase-2/ATP-dependent DNA helicase PcrA